MSQEGGAPPLALGSGSALDSSALLRFIRRGRSFSGHEPNCCFLNTGKAQFANVSAVSGLDLADDGRAVGVVDWDLDGDLDLWISNRNGPQLRLLLNGLVGGQQAVFLRLTGTKCNRDAIGARVELVVAGDARRQIKSLRAGDGYLAQSSKWLHFGLGHSEEIDKVVVRWPSGDREVFSGVKSGGRYDLVQGAPRAVPWQTAQPNVSLATLPAPVPEASDGIHVFSVSRIPVPRLPYRTVDGKHAEVFQPGSGKPVLLNLWASWCTPCRTELAELAAGASEIESAGLDVAALSVDGLDGKRSITAGQIGSLMDNLGFPFQTGRADARLVEKLQLLNNYIFDLHLPLPVPTSVLIDGEGRLAALYKGQVSLERVLADVSALGQASSTHRNRTTGFNGRWYEPLKTVSLVPIVDALTSRGFLEEADEYLRRLGTASKSELLPAVARLGIACYQRGMNDKARKHFGVIGKIDPTYVGVQTQLGRIYESRGRFETAVRLYREAIHRNPATLTGLNNLAWLLATCPNEAIRDGNEALELAAKANSLTKGTDPSLLDTMAAAQAQLGEYEAARNTARRAEQLARSRGRLALSEEIRRRLELYDRNRPFIQAN